MSLPEHQLLFLSFYLTNSFHTVQTHFNPFSMLLLQLTCLTFSLVVTTGKSSGRYFTSQVCKILESIIGESIVDHLNAQSLLLQSQHGFTKGKSCLTKTVIFGRRHKCYWWRKTSWCDIPWLQAFDKVPHLRLIHKIKCLSMYCVCTTPRLTYCNLFSASEAVLSM